MDVMPTVRDWLAHLRDLDPDTEVFIHSDEVEEPGEYVALAEQEVGVAPQDRVSVKVTNVRMERPHDEDPDLSYLTDESRYADVEDVDERARLDRQDRERLDAFGRSWSMMGVLAVCTLELNTDPHATWRITQEIRSPGVWGVETDSDRDHVLDLYRDELSQLHGMLTALGRLTPGEIERAMKEAASALERYL